jgi:hypothetical protein
MPFQAMWAGEVQTPLRLRTSERKPLNENSLSAYAGIIVSW